MLSARRGERTIGVPGCRGGQGEGRGGVSRGTLQSWHRQDGRDWTGALSSVDALSTLSCGAGRKLTSGGKKRKSVEER